MKKLLVISLLLSFSLALLAAPMKVAILGFTCDRPSANVSKSMMKRDFDAVLDESATFELISIKDTEKYLKQNGFDNLMALGTDQVKAIGQGLGADIVLWGEITSNTNTEFSVQMRVFIMRSNDIKLLCFKVTTRTDARREALANELFAKIEEFTGGEVDKFYHIAMQQYSSGNASEAIKGFLRVLELDPNHFDAVLNIGKIHYEEQEFGQSEDYLKQALELDPEHDGVINLLGVVYKEQDKFDEAIALLEDLAERTADPCMWLRVGNLYADIGYTDEAVTALELALELDEDYDKPHYRLALILFEEEDYDAALPHLRFVNDIYPDDEEIYRKLAIAYQKTGRILEAIEQYESVIASEPGNTKAYLNLAQAYRTAAQNTDGAEKQRLNQQAVQTLDKLLEIEPDNAIVPLLKADIHISLGDYNAAQRTAIQATELHPDKFEPHMLLFQIYQKRGYDTYNELIEVETAYEEGVRSGDLIGSARDDMIRRKEGLREQANQQFRQALDALNNAKSRTDKPGVQSEINQHSATMRSMIDSTKQQ
ncbi:MAG: tetratricopeptide repeat protein [Candidatus Cloacimonetes bacterium]|nr:tetratricopeptide repeat protein [Candidatus Cloacimonadota bacterium]